MNTDKDFKNMIEAIKKASFGKGYADHINEVRQSKGLEVINKPHIYHVKKGNVSGKYKKERTLETVKELYNLTKSPIWNKNSNQANEVHNSN